MADEQPTNLSSNPTTDARRNKNEIAPQMLIENSPGPGRLCPMKLENLPNARVIGKQDLHDIDGRVLIEGAADIGLGGLRRLGIPIDQTIMPLQNVQTRPDF